MTQELLNLPLEDVPLLFPGQESLATQILDTLAERQKNTWTSDLSPDSITKGGFLYFDEDGKPDDKPAHPEYLTDFNADIRVEKIAMLQALEYRVIHPAGSPKDEVPLIMNMGNYHQDETSAARLWWKSVSSKFTVPRIEALNASPAGNLVDRRRNVVPLTENQIRRLSASNIGDLVVIIQKIGMDSITDAYTPELAENVKVELEEKGIDYSKALELQKLIETIAQLYEKDESKEEAESLFKQHAKELRKLVRHGVLYGEGKSAIRVHAGNPVNLNRSFFAKKSDNTWEKLKKRAKNSEVLFSYALWEKYSSVETLNTIHKDNEFKGDPLLEPEGERGGYYFYYTPRDARDDKLLPVVKKLSRKMMSKVRKAGISIHHGVDDPKDPSLDMFSKKGFIYQPLINKEGEMILDNTAEGTAVFTGYQGLTNINEAFCFEIPGDLSSEKEIILLEIIRDEFMIPFAAHKRKLAEAELLNSRESS